MESLGLIFVTSLLVGGSGAVSPGPLLLLDIREAARRGFWAGPAVAFGHVLLELLVVIALALGINTILETTLAAAVIGLLGGLVLLWFGIGMLRSPGPPLSTLRAQGASARVGRTTVLSGALITLSNPYWFLWWATIGLTWMLWAAQLGSNVGMGLVAFYTGHAIADLGWYSIVSFAIARGRSIMGDREYRWVIWTSSAFLMLLGAYFLYSGVRLLLS